MSRNLGKLKWSVIIILQIIGCMLCLIGYKNQEVLYSFEDLSIESKGADNFVSTPAVDLKIGQYKFVLHYKSNNESQSYTFKALNANYQEGLSNNHHILPSDKSVYTSNLLLKKNLEQFSIQFDNNDIEFFEIEKVEIVKSNEWLLGLFILLLVFFAFADFFLWKKPNIIMMAKNSDNVRKAIYIFAIACFISIPLFSPYLFRGHDLEFHLMRIEGVKEGLLSGQFPVKIQPNWMDGHGYAASIFYGDLLLYIPAILRLIGFYVQDAYKIFVFAINFLTVLISFYCIKRFTHNEKLSYLGAFLYSSSIYRLVCIYTRGAVGEYCALTFLPMILIGLYEILFLDKKDKKKDSFIIAALGYSGLIITHVITLEIVILFSIFICVIFIKKVFEKERFMELIKMSGVVLVLSMWFLVPFLDMFRDEYYFNNFSGKGNIQSFGTFISQLLSLFPSAKGIGESFSVEGGVSLQGELPFALGGGFLVSILFFIMHCLSKDKKSKKNIKIASGFLIFGLLLTFMTTIHFPWSSFQYMHRIFNMLISNIQFPWRLLGIAVLFFSFFACIVVDMIEKKDKERGYFAFILILVFGIISSGYYLSDRIDDNFTFYIQNKDDLNTFKVAEGEYLPVNAKVDHIQLNQVRYSGNINNFKMMKEYLKIEMYCENSGDSVEYIDLPLLFYRGYQAVNAEDGTKLPTTDNGEGYLRVSIPIQFKGNIVVNYEKMWYWKLSELISLFGSAGMLLYRRYKRADRRYI